MTEQQVQDDNVGDSPTVVPSFKKIATDCKQSSQ